MTKTTQLISYKLLLLVLLVSSMLSCTSYARIKGNGIVVNETREMPQFSSISTSGSINIILTNDPGSTIELEGESNILPLIETKLKAGELKIKLVSPKHKNWVSFVKIKPINIRIPASNLVRISHSGSGNTTSETELLQDEFNVFSNGSGSVKIEGVFKKLNVKTSGSGRFNFTGHSQELFLSNRGSGSCYLNGESNKTKITNTGSGRIKAEELTNKSLNITNTGSGNSHVKVDGFLSLEVQGSGYVQVSGRAEEAKLINRSSGSLNALNLIAETIDYQGNGSGDAKLHATYKLTVNNNGSGSVHYAGNPSVKSINQHGSGSVKSID